MRLEDFSDINSHDLAGGKFLEDCSVAKPFEPEKTNPSRGYLPHAYDYEGAKKLWEMSNQFVGSSD